MAQIGPAFIIINVNWTALKSLVASKTLSMQYDDTGATYEIFAIDDKVVYLAILYTGAVPDGFDQSQNDADKADFLADYQPTCNQPIIPTSVVNGTSVLATVLLGMAVGDVVLAATSLAAVRRTAYTEPSANARRSFASSSANDTAAGTGVRKVQFTYFATDNSGPYTEIVTLNGTTAVNTVATNIRYVEKIVATEVGSGGAAAGTITMYNATAAGGGALWSMAVGDTQTFGCHHYVPSGKTCFVTGMAASGSSSTAANGSLFYLRAKPLVVNAAEVTLNDHFRGQGSTINRPFSTPLRVVGPARIMGYAKPETVNSITYRLAMEYYERVS